MCCCWMCGLVGLIYAVMARAMHRENPQVMGLAARRYLQHSRICTAVSITLGAITLLTWGAWLMTAGASIDDVAVAPYDRLDGRTPDAGTIQHDASTPQPLFGNRVDWINNLKNGFNIAKKEFNNAKKEFNNAKNQVKVSDGKASVLINDNLFKIPDGKAPIRIDEEVEVDKKKKKIPNYKSDFFQISQAIPMPDNFENTIPDTNFKRMLPSRNIFPKAERKLVGNEKEQKIKPVPVDSQFVQPFQQFKLSIPKEIEKNDK